MVFIMTYILWLHLAINEPAFPAQIVAADAMWPNRQQGIGNNLGDHIMKLVSPT